MVFIIRMEFEGLRDEGVELESRVYSICFVSGRYRILIVFFFLDMIYIVKFCLESIMIISVCRLIVKKL